MTTACWPRCSKRQAAPESANHVKSKSNGLRETKNATGAATQRLRHWKQSTSLPMNPMPKRARKRAIRSAGPSSLANKCVIRQVTRAASTSRSHAFIWVIASFNNLGCYHQLNDCTLLAARKQRRASGSRPASHASGSSAWSVLGDADLVLGRHQPSRRSDGVPGLT